MSLDSRRIVGLALALFVAAGPMAPARGQIRAAEYEIKAAAVFQLARFTEWPTSSLGPADTPIVLGVLGDDPFGPLLEQLVLGRKVGGRPVVIRRLQRPAESAGCHLLFVAASEKPHMSRILEAVSGTGVLTIGETDQFAEHGGVIGLVMGKSINLVVNTDAASRAHLKISSRVLTMARLVRDGKGGPP
jgi:hypothetical protein